MEIQITATQFEAGLRILEAMVGQDATIELFEQGYESLLNEVRMLPTRFEKLERMQRLLFQQFMFLFGEWRREAAIEKMKESGQHDISSHREGGMN